MRLATFQARGRETYGVVREDGVVDLGARLGGRYQTLKALIAAGLPSELDEAARAPADFEEAAIRYLPPITDPARIWCLALNYVEHHGEVQGAGRVQELPKQPAVFLRCADSLTGHGQPILHPGVSEQLDYEGELGVVIGKGGRHIREADAMDHIAGYTIINEGSVRDWQFHTRQITPGKNFYHSGAIGPWIVRRDDIRDPHDLRIKTTINGQIVQDGTTADMVHRIDRFIAYVSTICPLAPGDILSTGTPSGVGFSRKPPLWLKAGDECAVSIGRIGTLSNRVQRDG
ncbi:MAG TPA: fumarylacetoacetate hydrolase family protein [Steroidobacteraceae bacterium]|jgi:2-keto-4-pentenoate hydratase/2-oxohepta-3-ene-1,7-dioic acid hydratase in catechol pathway|nr:fumarylacetoacetate hydrolase family protein [Steroidobacteraceae bacterium]